MAYVAGQMVYHDYGEVPQLWHTRLVLGHVQGLEFLIQTPDGDIYPEILDVSNPDLVNFVPGDDGGGVPPVLAGANIYGFRPMTPVELAGHLARGRAEVAAERARRGLPPIVAPVAVGGDQIWVLAEMIDGRKIGETVFPPVGVVSDGDWGLMSIVDSNGASRPTLIRRISPAEVGNFCEERIRLCRIAESSEGDDRSAADDVRTLEVKYGLSGERQRMFRESIHEMQEVEFTDFPLTPRTTLPYLRAIASVSESSFAQHLAWVSQSKIPENDRSIHENEVLSRVIDAAVTYDCLNICNLASFELIVRRKQLIASAHSMNPMAPSYDGSEHFMGSSYSVGGGIIVPELAEHVSRKMQQESAILKERCKLAEAKPKGGKKGKDTGAPKGGGKANTGGSGS